MKSDSWIVLQTFFRRELEVSAYLRQRKVPHFIPMHYREKMQSDGHTQRVLAPIIHNYTFVENVLPQKELKTVLSDCSVPLHILCHKDTGEPCEISNSEMFEFRTLCDPQFDTKMIVTDQPMDLEVGRDVEIVHGHFSGIRGRLVRKQKQYWFVKTFAGLSVHLRITRWFCRPLSPVSSPLASVSPA